MKTLITFLFVATSLLSATNAQKYKKYSFKTGKVAYTFSGSTTGTKTVYWDDYGYKEVSYEESVTKTFGTKEEKKETVLILGESIYTWQHGGDEIIQTENPILEGFGEEDFDEKDVEQFGEEVLTNMGYEKIGNEMVLGKSCDVWKGMGKLWIWKGLTVKSDVKMMGIKVSMVATEIKTDLNVDGSRFELPAGKEVKKMEDMIPEGDDSEEAQQMRGLMKSLMGGDED